MKKRLFLVLIVCILLLTACAVGGTSGVERFKKTVQEELVEKDFHHVKETIVQKMEGIVSLKQEKQLWFCE